MCFPFFSDEKKLPNFFHLFFTLLISADNIRQWFQFYWSVQVHIYSPNSQQQFCRDTLFCKVSGGRTGENPNNQVTPFERALNDSEKENLPLIRKRPPAGPVSERASHLPQAIGRVRGKRREQKRRAQGDRTEPRLRERRYKSNDTLQWCINTKRWSTQCIACSSAAVWPIAALLKDGLLSPEPSLTKFYQKGECWV